VKQFDFALETIRDPSAFPGEEQPEEVHSEASDLLRSALVRLVGAASGNPIRLAILVALAGGMRQAEVGRVFGITKQAVDKHLQYVRRVQPALASHLRIARPHVVALSGISKPVQEKIDEIESKRQENLKCLKRKNQN
jgi:hypothetical protein